MNHQPNDYYFEDEIDLREYIEVLLRYWYVIVGLALLAALSAGLLSLYVLSPTYESRALVAVTKPRYTFQLDERFATTDVEPAYGAMAELATSGDLLTELLASLDPPLPPEQATLKSISGMVDASSTGDPSLIRLTVTTGDPELSARIANAWAILFVERANELYSESAGQVTRLEEQLIRAEAERDAVEQELVDFQTTNESAILQSRLTATQTTYDTLLAEQQQLHSIEQDVRGLQAQLASAADDETVSFSDELTALSLQVQAFNAEATEIQLQFGGAESLTGKTAGQLRTSLDDLVATINEKSNQIEERLAPLEAEMLELQGRIQSLDVENQRLQQRAELTRDTYTTVARKLEEVRVTNQVSDGEVRMASTAVVSDSPVGPRTLINTLVAGVLGLMIGVFGAFFVEYWQQSERRAGEGADPSSTTQRVGAHDETLAHEAQS